METRKLTVAITPESLASLILVRRLVNEDDYSLALQSLSNSLLRAVRDPVQTQLTHPISARTRVPYSDMARMAEKYTRTGQEPPIENIKLNMRELGDVACVVAIHPGGQNSQGIPWGYLPKNPEHLWALTGIGRKRTIELTSGEMADLFFATIKSAVVPFRDVVVFDPYLTTKSEEVLAASIGDLIRTMIPEDQAFRPRVTLVENTKRFRESNRHGSETVDVDRLARDSRNKLSRACKEVDWSLIALNLQTDDHDPDNRSLVREIGSLFHNRYLFTNVMRIDAGAGFAFVTRETPPTLRSDTFTINSVLHEHGIETVTGKLNELCTAIAKFRSRGGAIGIAGKPSENRLLTDMFTELCT